MKVVIIQSVFDEKVAEILSVAGASCQMCTATHCELTDKDIVQDGFRSFPSIGLYHYAIQLFRELEDDELLLSHPSNERFNLTLQPIFKIIILSASPLHSFTYIIRWFNVLVYQKKKKKLKWPPSTQVSRHSMKIVQKILD